MTEQVCVAVMLEICIQEVPNLILDQATGYPEALHSIPPSFKAKAGIVPSKFLPTQYS
jgi:hypothetical protein